LLSSSLATWQRLFGIPPSKHILLPMIGNHRFAA
jgi:hypothetical protein